MHLSPVERDDYSAPFFDGTAEGRLLTRRCSAGHYLPPVQGGPVLRCPECHTEEIAWAQVSGDASLVSWTVVPTAEGPLVAGIVELAEGPWMHAPVDVDSDAGLRVGTPLRVDFVRPGSGEVLPVFRPA